MRKMLLAMTAALAVTVSGAERSHALPLSSAVGLKPAADRINPTGQVRYCEYFDPELGDWVVFRVPGPCYLAGAPGFDPWIRRYYYGGRYWRGRLGGRPWVGRPAVVYRGGRRGGARVGGGGRGVRVIERGRAGPRPGGARRMDGGRRVGGGGGRVGGGRVGGGGRAGGGGRGGRGGGGKR